MLQAGVLWLSEREQGFAAEIVHLGVVLAAREGMRFSKMRCRGVQISLFDGLENGGDVAHGASDYQIFGAAARTKRGSCQATIEMSAFSGQ